MAVDMVERLLRLCSVFVGLGLVSSLVSMWAPRDDGGPGAIRLAARLLVPPVLLMVALLWCVVVAWR